MSLNNRSCLFKSESVYLKENSNFFKNTSEEALLHSLFVGLQKEGAF